MSRLEDRMGITSQPAPGREPDAGLPDPVPLLSQRQTAVFGALMVMLGPISLALYTPAMPAMVAAFDTSMVTIKLTVTVFFLGFAFSQLVCGPLSDAYGRRPVALGFFGIYLAGSVVAMLAPTVSWLIAARALQGIGCAAGIAVSRAIVRDQYAGHASATIMNLIGTILAIGPAVSPTLGGVLFSLAGIDAIFVAMAAYGLVLVALVVLVVPETNRAPQPGLARPAAMARSYGTLLASAAFMRPALVVGGGLGGIYTLAALLPFILIDDLKLSPVAFGLTMLVQTGSFMTGSIVAGLLMKRMRAERIVPIGIAMMLAGALGLAVGLRLLPVTPLTVMTWVGFWAAGIGLFLPGCTTGALAGFPHIAGAASALLGFLQIGGGFLGTVIAALLPSPFFALTTLMPTLALAAALSYVLLRPGHAAAPQTEPDAADLGLAADPIGVVGAAGDEIEAERIARNS